jgi:3,4-dihydroxy 2-butanone 4-phosphate synthase/GTP cyclohydrolase II
VVGWHGALESGHPQALVQELQGWAQARGLQVERDDDPRQRALLNQPQVVVQITGTNGTALLADQLVEVLDRMARWGGTRSVELLLAPDGQRSAHPPADLTAEQRPLAELGSGAARGLRLDAEALLTWS